MDAESSTSNLSLLFFALETALEMFAEPDRVTDDTEFEESTVLSLQLKGKNIAEKIKIPRNFGLLKFICYPNMQGFSKFHCLSIISQT